MSNPTIAKRYAKALFEVAAEQSLLNTIEDELRVVKEVFINNPSLGALLKSPKLAPDRKQELLKVIFASASIYVQNMLIILANRHHEDIIPEVAEHFIEMAISTKGIAETTVYSVQPLTDQQKEGLSLAFAPKVGKKEV